ncbi:MAG: hypothetical protein Q7O66_03325 [Dehalococcoidia bacterium]|nr:hypothetical protein [Dehalococcoidia bacterium]
MKYDPDKHHRRSLRLRGDDYSQEGAYFVTIAAQGRQRLFGQIVDGNTTLNRYGDIVREEWERSALIRTEIQLDEFVVMPNHLHGIVMISSPADRQPNEITSSYEPVARPEGPQNKAMTANTVGATGRTPLPVNRPTGMRPRSLGSLVTGFQSASTKRINTLRGTPGTTIWQRNYYEHVIRNEQSLQELRSYVETNGLRWELDQLHPSNPSRW